MPDRTVTESEFLASFCEPTEKQMTMTLEEYKLMVNRFGKERTARLFPLSVRELTKRCPEINEIIDLNNITTMIQKK